VLKLFFSCFGFCLGMISHAKAVDSLPTPSAPLELPLLCQSQLSQFKKYQDVQVPIEQACLKVQHFKECSSVKGQPIYHFNFSSQKDGKKKILVFSLIHGDELPAGSVGRYWIERLSSLENARNEWRVIPILNPDGLENKSRLNSRGVDLNRNFPTQDWNTQAHDLWKKLNRNPRRFPGDQANSEPETHCALKHIEDFNPDFIISVHTPLAILDFDGPTLPKKVPYHYLPFRSLGHFPGSLGRYMWFERQVPVLTAEFLSLPPANSEPLQQLQDVVGSLVTWL
jgi:murein peptide amidase A